MSDALRPSSLFTSTAPATAPSGVQGTLPNPPPEVTQLPTGTTLRGVVQGHDNKGHLLVQTDLGSLAVSTKAHLPPGSEVVLQIRSSGAQLHVLLMHSEAPGNGVAAHRGLPPGPNPVANTLPAAQGAGALPPDQLTLGQTVRAILQTPALLPTATGSVGLAGAGTLDPAIVAAVTRLAPGSQIILRILAVDAPTGAPPGTAPLAAGTGTAQAVSPGASPGAFPGVNPGAMPGAVTSQGPVTPSPVPGQASVLPAANPVAPQPGLPGTSVPVAGAAAAQSTPGPTGVPGAAGPASGPVSLGASTPVPGPSAGPPTANAGATTAQAPIGTHLGASAPAPLPGSLPASSGATYGSTAQAAALTGPYSAAPGPGGVPLQVAGAGTTAPAGPIPSSAPSPITGVVTATTNAGHPVLQTPVGTLTLEVQAQIPVGSRVVFELALDALPRETANLPASLARAWPEVEEAVRLLHEATPPGATPAAAIPQPGSRLASGLLFFLAALSGGDMSRWLGGQAIQALKTAGRDGLLARLGQDFGQLSRPVESGGTDWRLFLIPLLDGSQVQQIRFFERHGSHGRGAGDDQRDGESTRFILEVELSRMGDMQIDGLVRGKRFDLMLRTRRLLPDVMRNDITGIFSDANEAAGFVGSIGFQASGDWRFMPIDDGITTAADSGLVI